MFPEDKQVDNHYRVYTGKSVRSGRGQIMGDMRDMKSNNNVIEILIHGKMV